MNVGSSRGVGLAVAGGAVGRGVEVGRRCAASTCRCGVAATRGGGAGVALGATTVTIPRITASMVLSGVGCGIGVAAP